MPASKNQSGAKGIRTRRRARIVRANVHANKNQSWATACQTPRFALGMRTSRPRKYGDAEIDVNTPKRSGFRLQTARSQNCDSRLPLCLATCNQMCMCWPRASSRHDDATSWRGPIRLSGRFYAKSLANLSFSARRPIAVAAHARPTLLPP